MATGHWAHSSEITLEHRTKLDSLFTACEVVKALAGCGVDPVLAGSDRLAKVLRATYEEIERIRGEIMGYS